MSDSNNVKTYSTDTLALCPYLELKGGLKFLKADLIKNERTGKVKVAFIFFDPEGKGRDLEMEFRHSDEKKYRDCLFFYRSIIQRLLGIGE